MATETLVGIDCTIWSARARAVRAGRPYRAAAGMARVRLMASDPASCTEARASGRPAALMEADQYILAAEPSAEGLPAGDPQFVEAQLWPRRCLPRKWRGRECGHDLDRGWPRLMATSPRFRPPLGDALRRTDQCAPAGRGLHGGPRPRGHHAASATGSCIFTRGIVSRTTWTISSPPEADFRAGRWVLNPEQPQGGSGNNLG